VDSILQNIMKVQGVTAAAVFSPEDACLEFVATETIFEPIMLLTAIRAAEETIDICRTIESLSDAASFACELEHGYFLFRQSGRGRLGVMAVKGVNIAMLDVAIGVTALKLAQANQPRMGAAAMTSVDSVSPYYAGNPSRSGATPLPQAAMGRPVPQRFGGVSASPYGAPPSAFGSSAATGSQPFAVAATPIPGTRSGVSPQPTMTETWNPEELLFNGAVVPGSIGPTVMQHVLRSLSPYLSGHAKAAIFEELAQLGATPATAGPDVFTDFIHNVAQRIPDPRLHDEFIRIVLGDRK
jgi:hypothetical protein